MEVADSAGTPFQEATRFIFTPLTCTLATRLTALPARRSDALRTPREPALPAAPPALHVRLDGSPSPALEEHLPSRRGLPFLQRVPALPHARGVRRVRTPRVLASRSFA